MDEMTASASMAEERDFRMRARECVELAQTVRTPQQRTMLLHIADTWLRLADEVRQTSPEARPS